MGGPQFFETRMGQRFYEHTMPEVAKQLARIADALENIASRQPPETRPAEADPKADRTR
jgi:hypothetical protein